MTHLSVDALIEAIRARAATTLHAPTSANVIREAEAGMGLQLPPLLVRLYCEVSDGGFGPGYGMLTLSALRAQYHPEWPWPDRVLPLWHWGCETWSCVDANTTNAQMLTHDASGATMTRFTLQSWLEEWLCGTDLYEEIYEFGIAGERFNPLTKKMEPRVGPIRPKGVPWNAAMQQESDRSAESRKPRG